MGYLPEGAPVLVGAGGRRRPGAITRFCPPFGGQSPAIIRPHRLIARLVPVNAIPADCYPWPLSIPDGRALSASVIRSHHRPEDEFELVLPRWRRMPVTVAVSIPHVGAAEERTR